MRKEMWRSGLLFMLSSVLVAPTVSTLPTVNKDEARKAFEHLNQIRKQPVSYCQRLKFSPVQVVPRPALVWNDTLARLAERKAMDMATRNYFGHIDPDGYGMNYYIHQGGYKLERWWLRDHRENNFESLQAGGSTGERAIEDLILDYGVPTKGHRTHLLGVGEWNSSLIDIGIGFVQSDSSTHYQTYTCVLIAKHK